MSGDLTATLLSLLAAYIVGLSKGGLSNVGAAAVPLLALTMPATAAAALLMPIFVVSDLVGIWIYRHKFSPRNLAILIPPGLVGVLLASLLAAHISDAIAGVLVGGIGCAYCLSSWLQRRSATPIRNPSVPRGIFWGALTGFTSFVTHSGGATFQAYVVPQGLEKRVYAGTSTLVFAVLNWAKFAAYWHLQQVQAFTAWHVCFLLVPALTGTLSGAWIARKMPTEVFFKFINIALFIVSLKLLADGVMRVAGA